VKPASRQPHLPAWLAKFVLTLGGAGLFIVTFLDSSILTFPFVSDALVIDLSSQRPARMPYYAAMSALGSLAGCIWIYLLARKGGEAFYHRRAGRGALKAKEWVDRHAFWSVFVPSILPPPLPFKVFVLAEGVFQVPLSTFILAILLGRGLRYFAEGLFGIEYGRRSLVFLMAHGRAFTVLAVATLVLLYVLTRLLFRDVDSGGSS
jgi:membrane protein YqaA with SNARE-associated domain